jgi:hypothetical protein
MESMKTEHFVLKPDGQEETQEQLIEALLKEYLQMRELGATFYSIELCLLDKFTITRKKENGIR